MKRAKNIIDIETKINNGLVVVGSDVHIPFQDDRAVACFIKYCKEKQPEAIVLNGDILDMFMLSKFTKGEGRNPLEEITMCRGLLEMIRKACPTSDIYYVIGNHENRLEKYVLSKAPELASLIEDVFSIIKTEDFKIRGCASLTINDNFVCKHGTLLGNKSGLSAIKEMENAYMSGATGHCFSEDVEILTLNKGWIKVLDVTEADAVGTYNKETGEFEWNPVRAKFIYDDYKELYHIKSSTIDLMVTDKHGLIGYNRYNRKLEEFTADELANSGKTYDVPLACIRKDISGISLSEDEIRLLINICADASIEDNSFRWHLKKRRKINHLVELLNRLHVRYSFNIQSTGSVKIRISAQDSRKYLTYFSDGEKQLPSIIANCDTVQAGIVLDEYSITDGHKNESAKNSYQVYTNKEKEVDILQEMFVKNGMRSSVIQREDGTYTITINKKHLTTITKNNVEKVPYSGKVSCISVDNGTLVVRSKGKTIITQNTHRLCKYIARKSGRKFVWIETGCLCDMNPEYMILPNWQQGFCELKFKDGKLHHSRVIEIEKGKILE